MKKLLSISVLILLALNSFAQKSAVLSAFEKHGIDKSILEAKTIEKVDNYAFDFKYTSIAGDKETVTLAKYDPTKPMEERWTVISVKGKAPSKSQVNTFIKNHNVPKTAPALPDESTYKIEKETADILVISYKQDPNTLAAEAAFMKDCRLYMTVNLKTKRLESIQSLNEKPLKIKIFNAEKLDLMVKFTFDEAANRYFTASEDLNMIIKLLGQLAPMETISEYSNYKKVL